MRIFCFCLLTSLVMVVCHADEKVDYVNEVAPILRVHCIACHTTDEAEGGLVMETHAALLKGGVSGAAVTPGESKSSRMILRVTGEATPRMPPEGEDPLTDAQVATLTKWVEQGASGPDGSVPRRYILNVPNIKTNAGVSLPLSAIAIAAQGTQSAVGRSGLVQLKNAAGKVMHDLTNGIEKVHSLQYSADGSRLVVASGVAGAYGTACVYSTQTGKLLYELGGHRDVLYAAEFSPDGSLIATAGYDRQIRLWDSQTGEMLRMMSGHNGAVYDLAFSPDGKVIVSGCADETVKVWSVATGQRLDTLSQPEGEVLAVGVSHDGKFIMAGSSDNRLRVWGLESLNRPQTNPILVTRFVDETPVIKFQLTADGKRLVVLTEGGKLKVLDTDSWNPLVTLDRLPHAATDFAMNADENEVLIASVNGELMRRMIPRSGNLDDQQHATSELQGAEREWLAALNTEVNWNTLTPADISSDERELTVEDGWISASKKKPETDQYRLTFPLQKVDLVGLRLEVPAEQVDNFVVSEITAMLRQRGKKTIDARYVRVDLPGAGRMIHLAEIQAFVDGINVATSGTVTASSEDYEGKKEFINDGNTDGDFANRSVSHTKIEQDPWIEIDLGEINSIGRVVLWNRIHADPAIEQRLKGFRVSLLNEKRDVVWEKTPLQVPSPSVEFNTGGWSRLPLSIAFADHEQEGFSATSVLKDDQNGWAIGPQLGRRHTLTLLPRESLSLQDVDLRLTIDQRSSLPRHLLDRFRVSISSDQGLWTAATVPPKILNLVRRWQENQELTDVELGDLAAYHRGITDFESRYLGPIQPRGRQEADLRQATQGDVDSTLDVRGGASIEGTIAKSGEVDAYRWRANRGEVWAIDADAVEGSVVDPFVAIFDSKNQPVLRTRLQAVRDSYFTFRGKDSKQIGDFRLFNWQNMQLNDFLYAAGEVTRLWMYPRGPDSGYNVYPNEGDRWTYFGTSHTTHALGEPAYVVRPLAPGEKHVANGLPVFDLYYENDDDPARMVGKNSRLLFKAPQDEIYTVRISDTRGDGGEKFGYRLAIRPARPSFKASIEKPKAEIRRGSGREVILRVDRLDGFDGAVTFELKDLPQGLVSSFPVTVEDGQRYALGTIWASESAEPWEGESTPHVIARAEVLGRVVEQQVGDLGILTLGQIPSVIPSILPVDGLVDEAEDWTLQVRRGHSVAARVVVRRKEGFKGQVSFGKENAGRNAAHGVYVDNIGLNGLLVRQGEDERGFVLKADPVAKLGKRSFFLRGEVDGNITTHPITVEVLP
ncbi:hypothetical protein OAF83_01225 [Rubripirellula sp.]|nr:c-type cytochrome domain-containing protein [Rubripirellula sp.]MDB4749503.1 hypothetical protein [Rubripirellula sp.]